MHDPRTKRAFTTLGRGLLAVVLSGFLNQYRLNAAEGDCALTSKMHVYSSAFVAAGSGDLDGYELVLSQTSGPNLNALLFVYEGAPDEGIPLTGKIVEGRLRIEGIWTEHQLEYPSKREVVQTHSIKIFGTLDPREFRGTIKIEGLVTPEKVRLKRVPAIWTCKKH